MTKEQINKDIHKYYTKYVREYKKTHDKGMEPACFDEWYDNEYMSRLDCFVGFNTKQIWISDNLRNVLIDPPADILRQLPDWREDADKATDALLDICYTDMDWLYDKEYWLDIDTEV